MATYYESIATATCEFTFSGIPSYTASFSASATDAEENTAVKLSESAVLEVIQAYITNQQSELSNEIVDITYDVTYVNDNYTTFSVYLNAYTGSFNYATEPYSAVPDMDLNSIVVYNDNGQAQVFSDPGLNQLVGFLMYCDVSTRITLPGQPTNLALTFNYSYFLEKGTIITTGTCDNATDERGYFLPGTSVFYNIIGGDGIYAGANGNVTMKFGENNFAKVTFNIAK